MITKLCLLNLYFTRLQHISFKSQTCQFTTIMYAFIVFKRTYAFTTQTTVFVLCNLIWICTTFQIHIALYSLGVYASYYSLLGGTVYILVHVVVVVVAAYCVSITSVYSC